MAMAPEEQQTVARGFVAELQAVPSARLDATFLSVGSFGQLRAFLVLADGTSQRSRNVAVMRDWMALKRAMADQHGSWYSSTLSIGPDLSYDFGFNYDTDPSEMVEEGITDEIWLEDATRFPRPWREIPEWHPVKQQFTEESWAARLAR